MKNVILLISVIDKIIELLVSTDENNWVNSFKNFRLKCDCTSAENLKFLRSEILLIYGRMGSFNDLVLYKQGQLMIKETQKLDGLRKELFRILNDR